MRCVFFSLDKSARVLYSLIMTTTQTMATWAKRNASLFAYTDADVVEHCGTCGGFCDCGRDAYQLVLCDDDGSDNVGHSIECFPCAGAEQVFLYDSADDTTRRAYWTGRPADLAALRAAIRELAA